MPDTTRLSLFGVAAGSICVGKFTTKLGFVMDDGTGAGQFISNEPIISLPRTNPESAGSFPSTGTWPVMLAAVGADPMNWRFVQAPTAGTWRIETSSGLFRFVDASTIPGLDGVCDQSTTVGMIRPFGCYTADATAENPVWAIRRMALFDGGVLVGVEDEDGNRWMKCLNPASDAFEYPGTVKVEKLQYEELEQVDGDGDPITGGLEELNFGTVGDAVAAYYSPATKRYYRAPAHTRENYSDDSDVAITGGSENAIINSGSIAINYPTVLVAFNYHYAGSHKSTTKIYRDGSLIATFDGSENTSDPNSNYSGTWVDTGVTAGNHTYEVRAIPGTNGTVVHSSLSVVTLG